MLTPHYRTRRPINQFKTNDKCHGRVDHARVVPGVRIMGTGVDMSTVETTKIRRLQHSPHKTIRPLGTPQKIILSRNARMADIAMKRRLLSHHPFGDGRHFDPLASDRMTAGRKSPHPSAPHSSAVLGRALNTTVARLPPLSLPGPILEYLSAFSTTFDNAS